MHGGHTPILRAPSRLEQKRRKRELVHQVVLLGDAFSSGSHVELHAVLTLFRHRKTPSIGLEFGHFGN